MYIKSQLLDNYIEFGKQKEEKKEQKQIVKLLGDHEGDESPINQK